MKSAYGEVDANGNLRIVEKSGLFTAKYDFRETNIKKYENFQNLVSSITDSSIMDRIYVLPRLTKKQLAFAIKQKIIKDIEFIASLDEVEWIYSAFSEGSNYKVLVSIINKELLGKFKQFKALTATSQVISNFLSGKINDSFILVHAFSTDYTVIAFHNGTVDYVRSFKADSSLDDAIELTLEYYKEQKKIEIKKFFYTGDVEFFKNSNFDVKPLSDLIKIRLLENNLKFFVPFSLIKSKVPFFYKKSAVTFKHYAVMTSTFLFLISGITYFENKKLESHLENILREKNILRSKVNGIQDEILRLTKELQLQRRFQLRPDIKYLFSLKREEIPEFLFSLYRINKKSDTFLLSFKTSSGEKFNISTITFCRDLTSPVEFYKFVNLIRENPFVKNVKIIDLRAISEKNALRANLNVELESINYVE